MPLHNLVYHDALFLPAAYDYGWPTEGSKEQYFLEGLSQVEMPYAQIEWQKPEDFRLSDILAGLHEAWGTAELTNHKILDPSGMLQEFEYPDGAVTVDLKDFRYRIQGGPMDTGGFRNVDGSSQASSARKAKHGK